MNCPRPEDVPIPPEVREAAIWGRLTFFIGNGVSRLYGVPSWDELANMMLKSLVDVEEIDYNKYDLLLKQSTKTKISIADHFFKQDHKGGSPLKLSYKSLLHNKNVKADRFPAYDLLAQIGCRFLTTNYDSLFSDALRGKHEGRVIQTSDIGEQEYTAKPGIKHEEKESPRICGSIDEFSESDLRYKNVLVHLHGSISDTDSLVASSLDYINLYGNSEKVDKLRSILAGQTVVFVGYGLEELELLELIVRASRESEENGIKKRKYFNLLPLLTHEQEVFELLKIYYEDQLGITLLPYSRDFEDYRAIIKLIENWSSELSKDVKEPAHA
ncbi:MAG: SIR2 family protein, partial [Bdellovibrionales bacterium]|nr:SIR2 family protein [Bdellovibrionales bacterium]